MEIQSRMEGRAAVVAVIGRMDVQTAPAYQEKLNALMAGGTTAAVIDFEGLEYISSTGLRAVLITAKALIKQGGQVHFANVKGSVREVFDLSGFSTLFRLHDSVAAALAGII